MCKNYTCNECINYTFCNSICVKSECRNCTLRLCLYEKKGAEECLGFKPKSRVIELPCGQDDIVYNEEGREMVIRNLRFDALELDIRFDDNFNIRCERNLHDLSVDDIGKKIFLNKKDVKGGN